MKEKEEIYISIPEKTYQELVLNNLNLTERVKDLVDMVNKRDDSIRKLNDIIYHSLEPLLSSF